MFSRPTLCTGRWDRAEEMIRSALDHFRAAGVEAGQASAMLSMGDLKHQVGDVDEAMRWTNEAIEKAERLGETVSLAVGLQQRAEMHEAQGDRERCDTGFNRALALLRRAGLAEREAEALERYRRIRGVAAEPGRGG
jgi:tetratricopeptide (TPR) repeat protein